MLRTHLDCEPRETASELAFDYVTLAAHGDDPFSAADGASRLRAGLAAILLDRCALARHHRFLQALRRLAEKECARPEERDDARAAAADIAVEQGVEALEIDDLLSLLGSPLALHEAFDRIDAELPAAWLGAMEAYGADRRREAALGNRETEVGAPFTVALPSGAAAAQRAGENKRTAISGWVAAAVLLAAFVVQRLSEPAPTLQITAAPPGGQAPATSDPDRLDATIQATQPSPRAPLESEAGQANATQVQIHLVEGEPGLTRERFFPPRRPKRFRNVAATAGELVVPAPPAGDQSTNRSKDFSPPSPLLMRRSSDNDLASPFRFTIPNE